MYRQSEKLLNINIFSTCHHNMVNFGPLTAEISWLVCSTPANFNRFRVLASLLHRRRSTEVNKTLKDVWPSPGLVHYIYFSGALAPNGILPGAKFTLRPSLAFSYIGSVTVRHSSSDRQPNFVAWYKEWNFRNGTFAEGATYIRQGDYHFGHWPEFLVCVFHVLRLNDFLFLDVSTACHYSIYSSAELDTVIALLSVRLFITCRYCIKITQSIII